MIVAVIPAKGASSRLPNKNMQKILGRPLIHYAIEYAKASKLVDKIFVSTDCDEVAEYAKAQGIDAIRRGPELGGDAMLIDVYRHALKEANLSKVDYVAGVQVDHPDRTVSLDDAIRYIQDRDLDVLVSEDAKGVHNGSIYVLKVEAMENNRFGKKESIVDDCTNIHFAEDLAHAEERLRSKGA